MPKAKEALYTLLTMPLVLTVLLGPHTGGQGQDGAGVRSQRLRSHAQEHALSAARGQQGTARDLP